MLLQSSASVLDANVQKPPHWHRSTGNSKQNRTNNLTAIKKLCLGSHLCKVLSVWDSIVIILFYLFLTYASWDPWALLAMLFVLCTFLNSWDIHKDFLKRQTCNYALNLI